MISVRGVNRRGGTVLSPCGLNENRFLLQKAKDINFFLDEKCLYNPFLPAEYRKSTRCRALQRVLLSF